MRTTIEEVMGIPVVVEISDCAGADTAVEQAFTWLRHVDVTFSTYDEESEVSRLNRGELALADASVAVRRVLARCEAIKHATDGYFDAGAPIRGGIDPSGYVKGWAVQLAGELLRRSGARSWFVNAGGDIWLEGAPVGQDGWHVGVQHPRQRLDVAAVLSLSSGGVATSGAYERGQHVLDPHTGAPPSGLSSVTIVGADLGVADAYATAAFAMGADGGAWAAGLRDYGAIVIFEDDTIAYSTNVERHLLHAEMGVGA
ncbi:MAG: FAD:protein FMN transferase [Solirubrobacteraceae bacterium]